MRDGSRGGEGRKKEKKEVCTYPSIAGCDDDHRSLGSALVVLVVSSVARVQTFLKLSQFAVTV